MKPKEQTRLQVLNSLLAEHMTLDQAATLIGVSPRHTRRILADYRKNGAASLAHGHRGRKPANAIPETTRSRVLHLARTVYEGANHTHLSELLSEREGLDMGRTTLRRILVNAGLSSPRRRRPPKHRMRRQRGPGGHADSDGWQLSPVAGGPGAAVHSADRGGRCHRCGGRRPLLRAGGRPQLLPADPGPGAACRHTSRTLHRPARGLRHTPGPGLPGMPTQFSRAMDELGSPGPTR